MSKKSKTPVDLKSDSRSLPKDINNVYDRLKPRDTSNVEKVYWSFGFKFFHQIDFFGLKHSDTSWFISFLERLRDTSKMEYTGLTQVLEDGYRYHIINWKSKNCPLNRNEFHWVNKAYIDNEIDFPFCQFHVSKGSGRIIGFWDENNVFQIILLDPLHNLQPSKDTNYELRLCYPGLSQLDDLQLQLDEIVRSGCTGVDCQIMSKIKEVPASKYDKNVVVAYLDDEFYDKYKEVLKSRSISQLLEEAIFKYL